MILGIESSCDETALSLFDPSQGFWVNGCAVRSKAMRIMAGWYPIWPLASTWPISSPFGFSQTQFEMPGKISKIAVTRGPGLIGCLGIGLSVAKSLGLLWGIPVVGVNHLRGHAFSPFIGLGLGEDDDWGDYLPHLGLLVSGGNTLLFSMNEARNIEVLARTVDDAAGEALDKGGKLLGIPYPGGAELERKARGGDDQAFPFPRAFPSKNEMRFSFSGLNTSLLYTLRKMNEKEIENSYADLCASYQSAAIEHLATKTRHAMNAGRFKSFGLSGGVANNKALRSKLEKLSGAEGLNFLAAELRHTGDNASMIAYAAEVDRKGVYSNQNQKLSFNPSLKLDEAEN